jgi:hypothetical protein
MLQKHYTSKNEGCTIYAGSKIAGKVLGDTLYKTIKPEHFLRRPPAIAFDVSVLDQAIKAGAVKVIVTDSTGTKYKANIEHIRKAGFYFNRGFGDQVGLLLSGWIRTRKGGLEQLSLFGG